MRLGRKGVMVAEDWAGRLKAVTRGAVRLPSRSMKISLRCLSQKMYFPLMFTYLMF